MLSVLEGARNGSPSEPGGAPPQERQTWSGPQSAPPLDLEDEEPQRWKIGVDVNPASMAIECTGTHSHYHNGE